jgi:hypothetical protein
VLADDEDAGEGEVRRADGVPVEEQLRPEQSHRNREGEHDRETDEVEDARHETG